MSGGIWSRNDQDGPVQKWNADSVREVNRLSSDAIRIERSQSSYLTVDSIKHYTNVNPVPRESGKNSYSGKSGSENAPKAVMCEIEIPIILV